MCSSTNGWVCKRQAVGGTLSQLRERLLGSYVASLSSVFTMRPSQLPVTESLRKVLISSKSVH